MQVVGLTGITYFHSMQPDNLYFITSTIVEWRQLLAKDTFKDIIIDEWRRRTHLGHLKIYGFVIMPNHYHAIVNTPSPAIPADIHRDIHKWLSKQFIGDLKTTDPRILQTYAVQAADRKYQIWQRNPLAIPLYSREVIEQKLKYIHHNPLQEHWRLAPTPESYHYSSASFYEENNNRWDFLMSIYD